MTKLNLQTYEHFDEHSWIENLKRQYDVDSLTAEQAVITIIDDLEELNKKYLEENSRVLFTSIDGRVKSKESFFYKLYKIAKQDHKAKGLTQDQLLLWYKSINDFAGIRVSCAYYDEISSAINGQTKSYLAGLGYATDLGTVKGLKDVDNLDQGNEFGYRAYHFHVDVPTQVDIYGKEVMFTCEIQARSELQHIWAVKSHYLLYKPQDQNNEISEKILTDMRQISNSLRSVDNFLMNIRNEVTKI